MSNRFKFKLYKHLQLSLPKIYEEARRVADEIGIPKEIRGKFGLTGAISSCHGLLTRKVAKVMDDAAREVVPNKVYDEELREIIKSYYGDEYDALAVNTCEAALWLCFDVLVSPPFQGRGYNYRSRYIAPYERHLHHQGGYGRPFPPKYKDIFADRGCTAGELGFYGKRLENVDVVYVPLVGARYEVHGIKYHPVVLLSGVDPKSSIERIKVIAERHSPFLSGFSSLAYDTPGYGYGVKDKDGTPVLQKGIASLAKDFDVPYILDNAWGVPFIGADLRKIGGDVILYSMDKASGSPTVGLIIGREDIMVSLRRALGVHGDRWGTTGSYGKAAYVTFDPGKEALVGLTAALKELLDNSNRFIKMVDRLYEITIEEFGNIHPNLRKEFKFAKSYNSGAVEINYDRTWIDGIGLPIFSIEDMYSGTNILQSGLSQMGIIPTIAYDANIFISPGLGTTDENGDLIEDRMRIAIRGLVKLMEIVAKYAELI
ncbi:MAG: hypothetical protein H5T91_02230 [Synergistetes bacterium]|nr:MAG: hypothetical protein XD52_1617 [bacterium 42_11]MBC7331236.1 hypothetical protein [Synergistota bacterium]MDK2871536.1 hypothetical protein [bacterium]